MACMTRYVTKATIIRFINGTKLKSCRTGLANHTRPISRHWLLLPLGGHTDTDVDTHMHAHTHTHIDAQTKMILRNQARTAFGRTRLV